MNFSLREHRLCRKSDSSDYKYEENQFGNLPDETLFTEPGGETVWMKQGDTRVRAFLPTEQQSAQRELSKAELDYRRRLQGDVAGFLPKETAPHQALPSRITNPMEGNETVEVVYIPGAAEIRKRFDVLLSTPPTFQPRPAALQIMLERNTQFLAEKARRNDQSVIMNYPSDNLKVLANWETVPVGSFFMATNKPYAESMVYLKNSATSCESMCNYESWSTDPLRATFEREEIAYDKIEKQDSDGSAKVLVLAALTPEELERVTELSRARLAGHTSAAFEAERMASLKKFWATVA